MTTSSQLAAVIDHTLLSPSATAQQITQLCTEARDHGVHSVCVNPVWVPTAAAAVAGSAVRVCTVIGFPLGANTTEVKAFEAQTALADGAEELDMVINVGALKSGAYDAVSRDIATVAAAAKPYKALVKVIIETCLLTDEEKVEACKLAASAGADFVKTSTGFSSGGATTSDVALMRNTVGTELGVKASGGVRSLEIAEQMLSAGANRIGASATLAILKDADSRES